MNARSRSRARAAATGALALLALAAPAAAQKRGDGPPNDPSTDPYTRGEPEALARAGVVSLGGFEFSRADTRAVDDFLGEADIKWVETAHFELGCALGPYRVKQAEKKAIRAELEGLLEKYPEIDPKEKTLDPWLRAHMYAQRAERVFERFVELAGLDLSVFPDGTTKWTMEGPYWGEGPHLGQKGKYEILIVPSEASHVRFLQNYYGLSIKRAQRWNVIERDSITINMHTGRAGLREDAAVHALMAANIVHNLFDGLKHYSYDTPVWLHEGLAHLVVRDLDPRYNVFDGSEGSVAETSRKSDWAGEVKKLVSAGEASTLARLTRLKDYGELELADHFTTWSMVDFLRREHPEALAGLIQGLKGLTDEQGLADGSRVPDVQRELFRELLGMSYPAFDAAWQEWARQVK